MLLGVSIVAQSADASEPLPPLCELLHQAEQATDDLLARDKTNGDASFAAATACGSLAEALVCQADFKRATHFAIAGFGEESGATLIDDLVAKTHGKVPVIPKALDPIREMFRRRDL